MPLGHVGDLALEARDELERAALGLRERYPEMFSPSARCRAPHLNLDALKEELWPADVPRRHSLRTDEELLAWLLKRNAELAELSEEDWLKRRPVRGLRQAGDASYLKALAKAKKHGLFLGLDWKWLE